MVNTVKAIWEVTYQQICILTTLKALNCLIGSFYNCDLPLVKPNIKSSFQKINNWWMKFPDEIMMNFLEMIF